LPAFYPSDEQQSIPMIGYLYDASGHRVAEGTITSMSCDPSKNGFTTTTQEKDYILDQSGAVETVLTMAQGGAMQWDHSNIYAKGELVGAYTQTGLHFYLHDWQGTVRAVTDYAGVVEETCHGLRKLARFGSALKRPAGRPSASTHRLSSKVETAPDRPSTD
jgi:hypothetical protein